MNTPTPSDGATDVVDQWKQQCLKPCPSWMLWALMLCGVPRTWSCVLDGTDL